MDSPKIMSVSGGGSIYVSFLPYCGLKAEITDMTDDQYSAIKTISRSDG